MDPATLSKLVPHRPSPNISAEPAMPRHMGPSNAGDVGPSSPGRVPPPHPPEPPQPPAPPPPPPPYGPRGVPLEAIVERRRMRAADENDSRMLAFAIEAGLHFLRMLELQALSRSYRSAFVTRFSLQPPATLPPEAADPATARW